MFMNVQTAQRQSAVLSTQAIQSIQLLQYGHKELEDYLLEQSERNPFLDVRPAKATGLSTGSGAVGKMDSRRSGKLTGGSGPGDMRADLEAYCSARPSLRDHLSSQLVLLNQPPAIREVAMHVVESLDADGYFRRDVGEMANTLRIDRELIERALKDVQCLEPAGIGARDLAECLRLQLRDRGCLSEPMDRLLDRLDLLAKFDIAQLARHCRVSPDEVQELARVVRQLNPRPGSAFDADPVVVAVPDVFVRHQPDGTRTVEINGALMPRVIVNRQYYAEIRNGGLANEEKTFVIDSMQQASWIARQIEQRVNTLLKVATEIVSQQSAFFCSGPEHLRPLNLRDVAKAVDVHPSTVCRAIANKFMSTDWGTFELRYFFAIGIAGVDGKEEQSSQSIRIRIKDMIAEERAGCILSDDAIVAGLRREGVDIARRTVAKYREMLRIPSSSIRRRQKLSPAPARPSRSQGSGVPSHAGFGQI